MVRTPNSTVEDVRRAELEANRELWAARKKELELKLPNCRALYWAREKHVNTRLQSMTFTDLYYLLELYKVIGDTPHMVVEKSVQCGLSELFIVQSHIEAGELGLTVMYVLPKYELRNRFVNNRIYKLHKRIPAYGKFVKQAETKVHRTSLMHFGRGTLAYVGSNVQDEFIEIPVDSAYVDEKDRCNQSNLLMLPDRLTASPYKFQREISNPTTEGFGIDERYLESSRGAWHVKCPHCNRWFVPDFWKHVVREIGTNVFAPRDESADPDPQSGAEIGLMCECGKPVNRLMWGEWVHEYPGREWQGFRVSKVFSKFTTLRSLYRTWTKAVGNDFKTQIFYNSDLGLPFSSKGSKVTRSMLESCKRQYEWPVRSVSKGNPRFMGVDVGETLHVIMRERVRTDSGILFRLVGVWALPGFSHLGALIREWKPSCVVIDAMPEIHKIMEMKSEFSQVWSSRFQDGAASMTKNKEKREVRMDRTAILDYVRQGFELQQMVLPMQAEFIEEGEYYAHMQASTRILDANEDNPEKSRFVWKEGGRPDHFFLAEAYCVQAGMTMPDHGVFDFFEQEYASISNYADKSEIESSGLDDEERIRLAKLSHLTPSVFLADQFSKYVNKDDPPKPVVNEQRIEDVIKFIHESQGYVDVAILEGSVTEGFEDVLRVLESLGFKESKIKGQYVK